MGQRIAGPKGSKRRRGFLVVPLFAVLAVALFFITSAGAVHDAGVFELDNNAVNDTAVAGDDWDVIFNGNGPADSVFVTDRFNQNDNTFCGGTKEIHDINAWKWCQNAASNDKNDLEDAYAAIYTGATGTPEAGHKILYVGADRFANNGDSGLGFMFLQSTLAESACPVAGTNCVFNDGSGGTPHHVNGDIYVVSQFTGGGQGVTVDFYKWVGQGTANAHWQLVESGVDCDGSVAGDDACGTVFGDGNRSTNLVTDAPWPYTTKFPGVDANGVPQPSDFAEGTFFEGGVDLTDTGITGCFRTVLVDTSQSQNINESAQDYVFGAFEGCGLTIDTSPSSTTYVLGSGASITDHAEFAGTGVDNPPTPTGSASFFLCAPNQLSSGSCPDSAGTKVGSDVNLAQKSAGVAQADSGNAASLVTAVGTYCFRVVYHAKTVGGTTPDPNYGSVDGTSFSDSGECFTVTDTSSGTTAQNWIPNDSATFTSAGGSALAGSVTFKLYTGGTCAGTVLYQETISDITTGTGTASSRTVHTTNGDGVGTGLAADLILDVGDSPATVSWQATFTSTSTGVSGSTTHCERSDLTIDDDITN